MIFINRNKIQVPKVLESNKIILEKEQLAEYFTREQTLKQARYRFNLSVVRRCRSDLVTLFNNKCCYCETALNETTKAEVDFFRPFNSAINLNGKVSEGYWWIFYEWFNHYLSCPMCNRAKANRFPVQGERLKYPEMNPDLENYLLIDPCQEKDYEEKHFEFTKDGQVVPLTHRGEITIKVIGLNRKDLIQLRMERAEHILNRLEQIQFDKIAKKELKDIYYVIDFLRDDQPFLGLTIELISEWFLNVESILSEINPDLHKELKTKLHLNIPLSVKKYKTKVKKEYDLSKLDLTSKKSYFAEFKKIERVEIENFKIINRATIKFPEPSTDEIGDTCIMLIGENAVGKSSILQAIALTLIGEDKANELNLDPKKLVRRGRGIKEARVQIYLSDRKKPLEMVITKRKSKIRISNKNPQVMVVGYGSLRTLPEKGDQVSTTMDPINVKGLFRQRAKLRDVESWLGNTKEVGTKLFNEIAAAVIDLLIINPALSEKQKILYRYKNKVKINSLGEPEEMSEMCDGYKSVLAYSLDIMMTLASRWKSMQDAEAVVMIDEIGVNLHPSWKIKIVSLLRKVFPRANFIITTHDPLCLRDARKGEVYVMNRKPDRKGIEMNQIDIPPGSSIEQLYLGMWFKMDSTLDLDTTEKLTQHAQLILEKNEENIEEIEQLEKTLERRMRISGDRTLFGRFKQIFNDVIDETEQAIGQEEAVNLIKNKFKKQLGR